MEKPVRVRFAPSPTGPLHLGGVRTALYNYLFAKKLGGTNILRIEDTDQTRYVPGAEQYIIDSFEWLGIKFDEGVHVGGPDMPYRQSERKPLYKQYADQLINSGHAYYAFDTEEELTALREKLKAAGDHTWSYNHQSRMNMQSSLALSTDEVKQKLAQNVPYVVRLKVNPSEEISLNDLIRGIVTVNSDTLDDKVLFKSDGMPTYHLANVVDDYLMKISHVIRGEEWLPSAPLHVLLYRSLGWEAQMPQFAHLPLILKPDGNGKLSKRDGDRLGFPVFPLEWKDPASGEISSGYRESGWFPETVLNISALLGWHPSENKEVFNMEELIEAFSLEKVNKAGAKFDLDKAKWFNQYYLRHKSDAEIADWIRPELEKQSIVISDELLVKVVAALKERVVFAKDIITEGVYFFTVPKSFEADLVRKKFNAASQDLMLQIATHLETIESFDATTIEASVKNKLQEMNVGLGAAMPLIRILLTGGMFGPSVFEIAEILGKNESVNRIKNGLPVINDLIK